MLGLTGALVFFIVVGFFGGDFGGKYGKYESDGMYGKGRFTGDTSFGELLFVLLLIIVDRRESSIDCEYESS